METTKTCIKCNTTKDISQFTFRKDTQKYRNECKECVLKKNREYKLRDKDKIKHQSKEYYQKNKDKIKQYYIQNVDKIYEYRQNYKVLNRDAINKKKKEYYKENKEKIKKTARRYREENLEKIRLNARIYRTTEKGRLSEKNKNHKRRALTRDGDVRTIQLKELIDRSKKCYWCESKINKKDYHIDHIMPLSKGGRHTISNLVITCPKCNLQKNSKDPFEFAQERGRLL